MKYIKLTFIIRKNLKYLYFFPNKHKKRLKKNHAIQKMGNNVAMKAAKKNVKKTISP